MSDFLGLSPSGGGGAPRTGPRPVTVPRDTDPLSGSTVVSKIPEIDRLYQVQTNLLRLDSALHELEQQIEQFEDSRSAEDEAKRVRRQLDNSYRTLRTWLRDHG